MEEAPEKLYVHKSQRWGWIANEHNITKNDIEYVRKDAFIEKACDWIRKAGRDWYLSEFGEDIIDFVKLEKDFKKYMEDWL